MEHLASYYSKGKTLDEYTVGNAYVFPCVEYDYEVQSKYITTLAHAWYVAHDTLKRSL